MRRELAVSLALVLLTSVVYGGIHRFEFVNFDDPIYVTANPHITAGITLEGIAWAFTMPHDATIHPLTSFSHMLDIELFGLNPAGHHLVNLLFHIANTVLLFLCLRAMTGALWRSALVAALFAVHPLHVESVAWISERKDVLSTFFWMLTTLAYYRYTQSRNAARYAGVIALFTLGLAAKPMLVTLPCVLLLLDYWPLKRIEARWTPEARRQALRLVVEKVPLFVLAFGACALTLYAQRLEETVQGWTDFPWWVREANAFIAYGEYLCDTLVPLGLGVFYPHPGADVSVPTAVVAALLLALLTVGTLRLARSQPYLIVGWCWFLGTLVPVIGFIQVGTQAMADRYTYVPTIGLFIMLAWGMATLAERRPSGRMIASALATVMVAAYAVTAWIQTGYWRDSTSLFERALAVTEDNVTMHNNLGYTLHLEGRMEEAAGQFAKSLTVEPENAWALVGLGQAYIELGRIEDATAVLERCLSVHPEEMEAHYNLGRIMSMQGQFVLAEEHYRTALRMGGDNPMVHTNLGNALAQTGRNEEARAHYKQALEQDPGNVLAHTNLASALLLAGETAPARQHLEEALRLHPGYPPAQDMLDALTD